MEKSMVTQEFLDEFNNSELGKVLRLNNFKCSERTLQEVNRRLNKNYTKNYVSKGPFEILQVLDNHNALAYQIYSLGRTSTGVLVLLSDKKGQDFYDGQIIRVPRGKRAKQIRTFTYITKQGISKTVPVVEIQDK